MDLAEIGSLADRYARAREARLAADKIAATLKNDEYKLFVSLVSAMRENELSSVGGKKAIVKHVVKERPYATDWNEVYAYIKEHDAFDLLHKRITETAVELRREDGIEIPGLAFMEYDKLTVSEAPK